MAILLVNQGSLSLATEVPYGSNPRKHRHTSTSSHGKLHKAAADRGLHNFAQLELVSEYLGTDVTYRIVANGITGKNFSAEATKLRSICCK